MKLKRHLVIALLCAPSAALAQDAVEEKDTLLALLQEQTALATKTRLNADYVPGILSVLHGRDLELRGIRTVWEALALVPGVERAMEPNGRRKLLVRGMGNIWGSGNVKLLLNDVAMNTAERGIAEPLFNIPIEQVERIEVVRGPGSAVHGEFAYLGVINVITHSDAPRVFAFGGANNTLGGGAVARWSEGNASLSLSVSSWRTDGAKVWAGPDHLHATGFPAESNAPGYSNEALESDTGVLNMRLGEFSLLLQWNQDGIGDHLGINNILPPKDKHVVEHNRHRSVEVRQRATLGATLTADTFLGWQDASIKTNGMYVDAGPRFNPSNPSGSEIFLKSRYSEQRIYVGTDLTWQLNAQHTWLLGIQYSDIDVRKNERSFNFNDQYMVVDHFVVWDGGVEKGTRRRISSLSLQDEYRPTDTFTITAGARYDDYSDTGARLSPRLAGVWQLDDRHIIKAQYAEAFRPQTLYELWAENVSTFGAVKPATVRTYELAYIHKGVRWDNRLTGFFSQLDDMIVFIENNTDLGYANLDARIWGIEWEYRRNISSRLVVDGNVTFLDAREERTNRRLPGAPQWLANAGATYRFPAHVTWGAQFRYVGATERERGDPRRPLHGYNTLDLSTTVRFPTTTGLTWAAGVKNVFDNDVRYPAPYTDQYSYVDDYPRAGREWWTRISYDF